MRRTLILTLAVLACALAVCQMSLTALNGIVDEAQSLRSQALLAADRGEDARAAELLVQLAQRWREAAGLMEVIASHDALHDVATAIAEAQIGLEFRARDDFLRAMNALDTGLAHLRDEEAVRWENLY